MGSVGEKPYRRYLAIACVCLFVTTIGSSLVSPVGVSEEIPLIYKGQKYYFYDATGGETDDGCDPPGTDCGYDVPAKWAGAYAELIGLGGHKKAWAWVGKTVQVAQAATYTVKMWGRYDAYLSAAGLGESKVFFYLKVKDLTTSQYVTQMLIKFDRVVGFGSKYVSGDFSQCVEFWGVVGHQYAILAWVKADVNGPYIFTGISNAMYSAGIRFFGIHIADMTLSRCPWRKPGCPWVNTWDGSGFQPDNNVLWQDYSEGDRDYYKLENVPTPISGNNYTFRLDELGSNVSQLDKARLITVDHDDSSTVAVDSEGNIIVYSDPIAPLTAIDNYGKDILQDVLYRDGVSYVGYEDDYIMLDFGSVSPGGVVDLIAIARPKAIPVDEGGPTEVFAWDYLGGGERYGPPGMGGSSLEGGGDWVSVGDLYPRSEHSMLALNITSHLFGASNVLLKMSLSSFKEIDYLALARRDGQGATITYHPISWANHSYYGDVTGLVAGEDLTYVDLEPGRELDLSFIVTSNQQEERDFILLLVGYVEMYDLEA